MSDTIKMIEYEFNAQKALERIRYYRKQRDELLQEVASMQAKLLRAVKLLEGCQQALCWPVMERDAMLPHNLVEQIEQFLRESWGEQTGAFINTSVYGGDDGKGN